MGQIDTQLVEENTHLTIVLDEDSHQRYIIERQVEPYQILNMSIRARKC